MDDDRSSNDRMFAIERKDVVIDIHVCHSVLKLLFQLKKHTCNRKVHTYLGKSAKARYGKNCVRYGKNAGSMDASACVFFLRPSMDASLRCAP
uniref:Uncharacterized protein n=1 Tax=Romanomermis culicivorax TaxID=13658 RepID=A0A915JUQ1_ROMCU